jgi:hypothetical protein
VWADRQVQFANSLHSAVRFAQEIRLDRGDRSSLPHDLRRPQQPGFEDSPDFIFAEALLAQLEDQLFCPPASAFDMVEDRTDAPAQSDEGARSLTQFEEPFVLQFRIALATVLGLTTGASASARILGN